MPSCSRLLPSSIYLRIYLLLGLLGGLAGLSTTGLLGGGILLGLLGATDGADAGNGLLTEIGTVTVLGGLVGNTLVDPRVGVMLVSHTVIPFSHVQCPFAISKCLDIIQVQVPVDLRIALLAGTGVGAVVDGDEVLAGLVGVAGLLGGHGDTTVLSTLDTDGLEMRNSS